VGLQPGAVIETASGDHSSSNWGEMPNHGVDHGLGTKNTHRLVSLTGCGLTVLGQIHSRHLFPRNAHTAGSGGSARCSHTGTNASTKQAPLSGPLTCIREVPLFVRSATLNDLAGTLKAGARVEVIDVSPLGAPPRAHGM